MIAQRKIIHIDMDAFFAAVEERDNPEYRGKALAVGGSPKKRGVVSTANYEARKFGVFSAMPSSHALRLCPQLIFLPPRIEVYRQVSRTVMDILRKYSDLVEPLSFDEAYIDVTSHKSELVYARDIAAAIKAEIFETTKLTASAGVASNKFLAKIASDMNKPNGLTVIRPEKVLEVLENLAVRKIPGIGKVTAQKMSSLEIYTAGDLRKWSEENLREKFGKVGGWFYKVARGIDDRPVIPEHERKSLSAEDTFESDIIDQTLLRVELRSLATRLSARLKRTSYTGKTLTLKVTYGDFTKLSRSRTLDHPIQDELEIFELSCGLLAQTEAGKRPIRLLGVALDNLRSKKLLGDAPQEKTSQLSFPLK